MKYFTVQFFSDVASFSQKQSHGFCSEKKEMHGILKDARVKSKGFQLSKENDMCFKHCF